MQPIPRSLRFRPPGQTDGHPWIILEVANRDCLLFVHPEAQRRRLTPAPSGWPSLGPEKLAELLARATPAPVAIGPLPDRAPTPLPSVGPSPESKQEALTEALLIERERRLAAEQLLEEAHTALTEMERDLESANAELRTLNEELQAMAQEIAELKVQGQ